jgi:hypothetical protein
MYFIRNGAVNYEWKGGGTSVERGGGEAMRARISAHPHERSAVPMHPQITKHASTAAASLGLLTQHGRLVSRSFWSNADLPIS